MYPSPIEYAGRTGHPEDINMKRIAAFLLCLFLCFPASAGNIYTLPIDVSPGMPLIQSNYIDENTYIDPTVEMHISSGTYEGALYWVADVRIAHASQLRTMPASHFRSEMRKRTQVLSVRSNAVIAINGDFYAIEERLKGQLLLRQGVLYAQQLIGVSDVLLIDEDGDFHFIPKAPADAVTTEINGKKIINGFCFGPILVRDGVHVVSDSPDKYRSGEDQRARTAICQLGPLHYAAVCCSDRTAQHNGMTLNTFGDLVMELGAQQAYNLDGGNSTAMYTGSRMINKNRSLRNISDIIYFASAWPGEEN